MSSPSDVKHDVSTAAGFRAALRAYGLTATNVPNVYRDTTGVIWHVDDPEPFTSAERAAIFAVVQRKLEWR